jgi:hypothetical protein
VKKESGTVKSDLVAVSTEVQKVKASGGSGSGTGGGGSGGGSSSSHSFVIDSSFPIPIYNSSSMSPDHFLLEVEEFLTLKGINKTAWTALVSRMLPSDSDLIQWWRAVRTSVVTWDDFKRAFNAYESSDSNSDILKQKLFSNKQRLEDPFESFAWEIHALYLKINSAASQP